MANVGHTGDVFRVIDSLGPSALFERAPFPINTDINDGLFCLESCELAELDQSL